MAVAFEVLGAESWRTKYILMRFFPFSYSSLNLDRSA